MRDSIENHIKAYFVDRGENQNSRYRDRYRLVLPNGESCVESMGEVRIEKSNQDSYYKVSAGDSVS